MLTIRNVRSTESERIPSSTRRTTAHGDVIDYIAPCTGSARANAWIHAILIDTGFHSSAIRVHGALWTTVRVRIAMVIRQTCTETVVALCVGSTRRWVA